MLELREDVHQRAVREHINFNQSSHKAEVNASIGDVIFNIFLHYGAYTIKR